MGAGYIIDDLGWKGIRLHHLVNPKMIEGIISLIKDYFGKRYEGHSTGSANTDADGESGNLTSPNLESTLTCYDIGCGDGRVCIAVSKACPWINSVGIEIEESLAERMEENIKVYEGNGVGGRVSVIHDDLRDASVSADMKQTANIILCYLLPESIEEIKQLLIDCLLRSDSDSDDCIIICNTWGIKDSDIKPISRTSCGCNNNTTLSLYDKSSIASDSNYRKKL